MKSCLNMGGPSSKPKYSSSLSLLDAYGAITRYGRLFQVIRLYVTTALAWSRFARHYYGSLG